MMAIRFLYNRFLTYNQTHSISFGQEGVSAVLLTNDELQLVRETVETQSGMDADIVERCSRLIHINAFDEAVQQAFVVLEERLRRVLRMQGGTGMQMVNAAFSTNGLFTKLLSDNPNEKEGFQGLLTAAFKLYRNPSMHTIVGYSSADARAVVGLVDLILRRIERLAALPQPGSFPANVEQTLVLVQNNTNQQVANYVRLFFTIAVAKTVELVVC
jgi:uncharacterized protein (TIGR02391 family)